MTTAKIELKADRINVLELTTTINSFMEKQAQSGHEISDWKIEFEENSQKE